MSIIVFTPLFFNQNLTMKWEHFHQNLHQTANNISYLDQYQSNSFQQKISKFHKLDRLGCLQIPTSEFRMHYFSFRHIQQKQNIFKRNISPALGFAESKTLFGTVTKSDSNAQLIDLGQHTFEIDFEYGEMLEELEKAWKHVPFC